MKILDVSEYQGAIDWKKVKEEGIKGVIIRAGYGKGNADKRFCQNIEGAIKEGLNIGIYWFSYAYTQEMARQEAIYCHAAIDQYSDKINLPIFFDWEYDSMRWAEKNGKKPDKAIITEMIVQFCTKMMEMGWMPGYYLNQDYAKNHVDETRLKSSGFYRWFAKYTTTECKDCYLWQYTSKGTIAGIKGNVDVNELWNETHAVEVVVAPVQQQEIQKEEANYEMRTIKKGSRGKAVKIWQIIVGAEPDGIFGAKTEAATKEFQERKKLTVDGIVGPISWKAGLNSVQ